MIDDSCQQQCLRCRQFRDWRCKSLFHALCTVFVASASYMECNKKEKAMRCLCCSRVNARCRGVAIEDSHFIAKKVQHFNKKYASSARMLESGSFEIWCGRLMAADTKVAIIKTDQYNQRSILGINQLLSILSMHQLVRHSYCIKYQRNAHDRRTFCKFIKQPCRKVAITRNSLKYGEARKDNRQDMRFCTFLTEKKIKKHMQNNAFAFYLI